MNLDDLVSSKDRVRITRKAKGTHQEAAIKVSGETHNEKVFFALLKEAGIPQPTTEYGFCSYPDKDGEARKFRFDYCWLFDPSGRNWVGLALEVDGGIWMQGRHSQAAGIIRDMEKKNYAAAENYRILYFTPQQLCKPESIALIRDAYYGGGDFELGIDELEAHIRSLGGSPDDIVWTR